MKPLPVILLSIFLALEGLLAILTGVGMILAREEFYELMKKEFERALHEFNASQIFSQELFDEIYEFTSIALIFIGLLYLMTSLGVFMLKNWARIAAVFLLIYQLLYSVFTIFFDISSVLGIVLSVFFIWFLLRGSTRELFSGRKMSIEEKILGRKI
uniref:DUF7144 domain-containing protein n=1 Tax=Archaeoglobus fulgidus TaxID=2234 RepID=A0A7J2TJD0_ARCFL